MKTFIITIILARSFCSLLSADILVHDFNNSGLETKVNTTIVCEENWGGQGNVSFDKQSPFDNYGYSLKVEYFLENQNSFYLIRIPVPETISENNTYYLSFWIKKEDLDFRNIFAGYYDSQYKIKNIIPYLQSNNYPKNFKWKKVVIPLHALTDTSICLVRNIIIMIKSVDRKETRSLVALDNISIGYSDTAIGLDHYYVNTTTDKEVIRMDGLLDERSWQNTPLLVLNSQLPYGTSCFSPSKSKPGDPKQYYDSFDPSSYYIKFLYDKDYLYLGIISDDKYIEQDGNVQFGLNADGLFSFVFPEKGVKDKLFKQRLTWTSSPPRPYDSLELAEGSQPASILQAEKEFNKEGQQMYKWAYRVTEQFRYNENNPDDQGYAFEFRIPLKNYAASDTVPANLNFVDHDLNPGGVYDDPATQWRKFWWGNGDDNAYPPQKLILSKKNFWFPEKPKYLLQKIESKDKYTFFVQADNKKADIFIECVIFLYSEDGTSFRTIGYDYDTNDRLYQLQWNPAEFNLQKEYYFCAAAQNIFGNRTYLSSVKITQ